MKITEDMIIGEVLNQHPDLALAFMNNGLFCIGCPGARMETIREASMVHGIDLEHLIKDLNTQLADLESKETAKA